MAVHGVWCHAKTFPLKCRSCGEQIYFFSCDHQIRVLFDSLGWPWPIHYCGQAAPRQGAYAGPSSWGASLGINIFTNNAGPIGLLPGWQRGADSVDPALVRRIQESGNQLREILRIDPAGPPSAPLVGVVQELTRRPDLAKRYGLERRSIGYQELAKQLGDGDPVQITIFVDELAEDPAAIDYSGYTFYCRRDLVGKVVRKGALIETRLAPKEVWGVGRLWVAQTLEPLL